MKKLIILVLAATFLLSATHANAQTWAEWFKQKKTQKKYLLQQIAALQVYIDYAQKGYRIAKDGLGTIGKFADGEFDLHGDHFASLATVNPEIRQYTKVARIIAIQVDIIGDYNRNLGQFGSNGFLSTEELGYINRVFGRLMDDCEKNLDELISLTTDGNLKMTDDERMARIDSLYDDMLDKYTFSKKITGDTKALALSRARENRDIITSRALQGITTGP